MKNRKNKARLIKACFFQNAAKTAQELIVAVSRIDTWKRNRKLLLDHYKKNGEIPLIVEKYYNRLIKIKKNLKINHEKLFRKDSKYDLFILAKYKYKKTYKNRGSAIFLHLTKNYLPTKGCIAVHKNDFLILNKWLYL